MFILNSLQQIHTVFSHTLILKKIYAQDLHSLVSSDFIQILCKDLYSTSELIWIQFNFLFQFYEENLYSISEIYEEKFSVFNVEFSWRKLKLNRCQTHILLFYTSVSPKIPLNTSTVMKSSLSFFVFYEENFYSFNVTFSYIWSSILWWIFILSQLLRKFLSLQYVNSMTKIYTLKARILD